MFYVNLCDPHDRVGVTADATRERVTKRSIVVDGEIERERERERASRDVYINIISCTWATQYNLLHFQLSSSLAVSPLAPCLFRGDTKI